MDDLVIQQYLKKVPVEIREAVMELDTDQKWAIFIALTIDGNKYFNQLKKEFGANPNTIDKNLKSLINGGLVDKKVKKLGDIGDNNKIYYTTTKLGEKLLANLYKVVLPPMVVNDMENFLIELDEATDKNVKVLQSEDSHLKYEPLESINSIKFQIEGVKT